MKKYRIILPCHFGLEAVLKREVYDLGYDIDKKLIESDHVIDTLGVHKVKINLHKKVIAYVNVSVN